MTEWMISAINREQRLFTGGDLKQIARRNYWRINTMNYRELLKDKKRVVIKVGSSSLIHQGNK